MIEPRGLVRFAELHANAGIFRDGILEFARRMIEPREQKEIRRTPPFDRLALLLIPPGEFAGLLAIRGYHRARGEGHRDVCLIPSSAHGTNAASAVMAGMKVVAVACDKVGNIDVADLTAKATVHAHDLAALMVTYPSTHGVYEEAIVDICAKVHAAGGHPDQHLAGRRDRVGALGQALVASRRKIFVFMSFVMLVVVVMGTLSFTFTRTSTLPRVWGSSSMAITRPTTTPALLTAAPFFRPPMFSNLAETV